MKTVSKSWLLDQAGVLHAAVRRIHRGQNARGPEQLQRIDDEIERGRREQDERARAEKPEQIFGGSAHQNLK